MKWKIEGFIFHPFWTFLMYSLLYFGLLQDIKQLASALSKVKLKENSLIRILWPKQKCKFLREDVVFLDRYVAILSIYTHIFEMPTRKNIEWN